MPIYAKPHLSLSDQVRHLSAQGLDCDPEASSIEALHDYGYYRLTAYTYPFRRLLLPSEPKDSAYQFRADDYLPGARLSEAAELARFDHGLRDKLFDGIAALELALRFQIAHVLGKRNPFGHTDQASLDGRACAEPAPHRVRARFASMFDFWIDEYGKLIDRAGGEDFIRHVRAKYQGEVPVWIAVETFDFGGLARLYSLLERYDQNLIARRFGMSDGRQFHQWLVGLGVIRNHCAHHNRLWNRQLPHALAKIPPLTVKPDLHHLSNVAHRRKLYGWISVLAYTLRNYDNTSNWFRTIKTQLGKFPASNFVSLSVDVGFPAGWDGESLWNGAPSATRTLPTPV
ncbi:hypothetical protein B7R54_02560 [Subtercola boreus]|uniref:Abortive phage infection protein n=1 Tax=Subtercola boreus TaxID=120213 RepID=A0A3E0VFK0_9MICO|nr:Abi family protein [Subtercola boreus]RFA08228.1 hypothetical protein B7R54_02560 [Subtercola boreus]TQL54878.1 abortive infection bacteriophage resistance protein [Subtercola boreus]